MKSKQVITIVLLVFVAATVAAMMYQEFRPAVSEEDDYAAAVSNEEQLPVQIIAYYFFGNQRCPTCMNIEAYTQESLVSNFQDELDMNLIVWKPVNVERAGNEHFIQDFQLNMKMVVLAIMEEGELTTWKKLEDVWPLSGDREAFLDYIKTETEAYLKEIG
ncbi:MAG: nitrophenyl compound nitroreductase subunit ArsF family protein [Candidatus Hinthialibacter sp.]